ncbi:MAG: type II secretion system protein E [Nitrospirales bacterium]|nr:MAG: type II secretion system protein E [Nitrospirales bacterium]
MSSSFVEEAEATPKPKRLGDRLVADGLLLEDQLNLSLKESKRLGKFLGETLVSLGFITDEVLTTYLATESQASVLDLTDYFIPPDVLELVPHELSAQFQLLPLSRKGNLLKVALVDTYNVMAVDTIERVTGLNVEVVTAPPQTIADAIERYYAQSETITNLVDQLAKQGIGVLGDQSGTEAPMIRLCNQIITFAIQIRATDIHVEPDEQYLRIRIRVDGLLGREILIPKALQASIIARLKLMATLNVTEKRLPQDGRIPFTSGTKRVDLRVSTLPTNFGESLVMRILDKSAVHLEFGSLGFTEHNQKRVETVVQRPYGILLVTGPTGSGKTTTLYTSLRGVNAQEKGVFTLEDPVEYQMPMVRQTQVNPGIGMTFATGLRALLRQDPDVIMVGEIRDLETADLAMRAAMTGHLVFSTLHTNDAVGAIPRLIDMGIEPYLLASALSGVVAQRLVRLICHGCKEERTDVEVVLKALKIPPPVGQEPRLWMGKGCRACGMTGFRGRQGIFEVLLMNEQIHLPIVQGPDLPAIRAIAKRDGMQTMKEDGLAKAFEGLTTVEEVLRVVDG